MTKPKRPRPPKPKKIKPVLAWCVVGNTGDLWPSWTNEVRSFVKAEFAPLREKGDRIIRVEIRPAPKRKAKRGAK